MSSKRKFNRKSKYTLSQKIVSAVTAAGFIMQPVVGFAQAIIKADSALQNTVIDKGNGVTEIWADKVVGNAAVNVFDKFQLDANNIANMYFNTMGNKNPAKDNLVNFVNSRIDINGTVNAIKDNKIGGNLFFLSKDGMAVGKYGVINTGSLYVMTPTQDFMDTVQTIAGNAPADTAADKLGYITNITNDAKAWEIIPVNNSGTITVLGKVNATNEVQMRAAKIGVGKNVSGELTDDDGTVIMEANAVNNQAYIKTGVTDFADIVKLDDEQRKEAGITNLTATQTGSGNIVLSAYTDTGLEPNSTENIPVIGAIEDWGDNTFKKQDFNASVDVAGTVETTGEKGGIDISATAINSNADKTENADGTFTYEANDDSASQLATVKADVNISGTVKAKDDVNVKAEAVNRYIDSTGTFMEGVTLAVNSLALSGDVAYAVLDTDANVNIADGASVSSEKGSVDIKAEAETLAASAASVTAKKFWTPMGNKGSYIPAAAVVYTEADNDANVTIAGDISAAKDLNVNAEANMTIDAENKMGVSGSQENTSQIAVGVAVTNAANNANVNITKESGGLTAGNNLTVNAAAQSDFNSTVSITTGEANALATAVNVANFDSAANVGVDTALTAENDLTVAADNTITGNDIVAENKVGVGKYESAAFQIMTNNGTIPAIKDKAMNTAKEAANIVKQIFTQKSGETKPDAPETSNDTLHSLRLDEIFKAGVSAAVSNQNNESSVKIGANSNLNAKNGTLNIDAKTTIKDTHMLAQGATNSYNDAQYAPVVVSGSVLVNDMNNSSSVVVEDSYTDEAGVHAAKLSGKNGVNINAGTRFEYNRINNMINDVNNAVAELKTAMAELGNLDDDIKNDFNGLIDDLNSKLDNWDSALSTFESKVGNADETLLTSDDGITQAANAFSAAYDVLNALDTLNASLKEKSSGGSETLKTAQAAFSAVSDLFSGAFAFADPNSYGNFAAVSTAKSSTGDTGTVGGHAATAANGAGAAIANMVNSTAKVEIGKGADITSEGDVAIGAENFMKDVSLGGLTTGIFSTNSGTAAAIGATVNYSDFNTDTIIAVNDGASITGGNIDIDAQNTIDHVSVAASSGKGPSDQTESSGVVLNGMVSLVNGNSNILNVIDDGATLTAVQDSGEENDGESDNKASEGNISITGHNNTNIVNVAGGISMGSGSAAIGVGVAYTDFGVKNITGVADVAGQVKGLYATNSDGSVDNEELEEAKKKFANVYEEKAAGENEGGISAYGFNVDAATDGSIQSVSVAGSASKNDATGETGKIGQMLNKVNALENKLVGTGSKLDQVTGKIFNTNQNGTANDFFNMGQKTHGSGNAGGINIVGGTSGSGGFMPSFSIAGSGSVSVNILDNATQAIVDNAKITMQKTGDTKGDINVTARDALYAGSYSGAAALQWKSGGSKSDQSVGFSGAAGVNDIDNAVKAIVKNSTITNAGEFNTMALSGGEQLALGLGLNVAKSGSTSGTSVNAAASVNLIDHNVEALHENNNVTDTDDVKVSAYARDIENTGGGTLSAGQQKTGVGASVGVAMLNNNITAGIKGGSYKNVGNVDVEAQNALKNITVGIAAGLTIAGGGGASANVEGAGVYNEVHNTTNAFIKGDGENKEAVISTVDGGSVNVMAQDVAIEEGSLYEKLLADGLADGKKEIAERMGDEFDISGQSELAGVNTSAAETELNKNKEETETKEEVSLDKTGGSSIITVAGGVAATTGKGSGGAAVAITDIENNYAADIDYADITTETLTADAGSNSNIVTVAGGVAVAGKGSGVGSVSWNDVDNTAKVNIKNSVVKAQSTTAIATNAAQIVSVGGQISVGGKAGVGAVLSYVGLDNSTEANIVNTTFDKRDTTETEGTNVKADAQNTSDSYNIGAGVSAAGTAAVSGTVVVTQTHGTAGAVMDGVTINNAKAVTATALDDTNILSVIGSVAGSGTAAVGGGVAYTEIGDVSTDTEDGQYVTAEIKNNSTIKTAGAGSTVDVTAKDTARVINVAVGVGGAGTAAVQGASATTLINKTTSAEIANTDIDEEKQDSTNANVTVDAQNASEITSSASTVAVVGSGAGVGAGIAVNRIIQQTNAAVNGGIMNVNNLNVNANSTPRIENIGVGGGIAGTGAGISGSVAVNMIENDVSAHIGSGANIVADGSVGVVATSDEQIANYAGQLAVGGVGAGVGVSVSVNQIAGTTSATVGGEGEEETHVTAKGNGSITTDTVIDVDINDSEKSDIHNTLIDDGTVALNSSIGRGQETRSGLIVDASSTRDLKSFLITAGVAGTGAGVTGTVNVNQIDGKTTAGIANTTVNSGSANAAGAGNVFVNAGDYSNMSGFVGSAGVGGIGAGVGLGSDTNTISREVTAKVDDSDIKAQGFEVDADSAQGISSFGVGAGVAGIGGGVAGIVTVTELNNTTKAMLNNSKVNANTVNIKANHTGIVNAGNVGVGVGVIGAGAGLSVGVLKDNSATEVSVTGDNAKEDTITASGDVTIAATNTAVVKPVITATGAGAAGVAGATSINNLNSTVKTNIKDVGITSGGSISGTADNNFDVDAYMGSQAGGVGGVGVGVTVNTIDSTVQTNVADSTLDAAEDITLTAQETRTIKQTATNVAAGGVAVGANIAVTNVGQAVENIKDENGETVSNAYDKITEANDVYKNKETGEDNSGDLLAGAEGALETAGIDSDKAIPHVDAGYGGENKDSQITVNITNSNIEADNNVTAKATETDNINMTLGSGAAGAAAVNAGVGVLNVHRNVGVNITGGGISADKIDIGTDITGSANLEVYQGTAGVVGVNAAVGEASTTGSSKVDIDDVIFAGNDIDITAADHGGVKVETLGITVGAVSVGAIVAGAENSGNTEIEITNSEAAAKDDDKQSDINISTDKANTVDAHAIGGAGGAVAGQGVVATAKDSGASSITLGAQGDAAKENKFVVNKINVAASAKPFVKAVADSAAVSIFGTAGASVATAEATGNVNVNVYDGNTLSAEDVDITGEAGTQDGKNTAEAKVVGNSGSGYVTVADNAAVANVETHVNVNVGDVNYKTNTEKVFVGYEDVESSTTGERKEVYKDVVTAATDLNISGSNTSKASTDAKGITIGGIFSSGNNQAFTTNKATTNVSVSGGSEETLLKSLNITASGATDNTAKADGSGGGLVSGDLAAWVKNDSQAEVNASLSGSFNVAGDVTVNALQSDTANINADALKATVVGASATLAENNIGGSTTANINGATITGGGKLDVNAANTITFGNNEQYAVEGSGYGGVNVQGAEFDNIINKKAAVNVTGSKITTNGAQAFEAKTTGNINAGGYIKAAGLGAFTWADIDNTVTSDNSVTVDEDSALKTKKEGADITLAAVDNMDLTVRGQADVQGAAIGGASSDVESVLNRNNKITVGGDLYAMNDVNLYAGKDKNGADGSLDLVAESETYNYAALPIADPKLDDQINQNNQVVINTGSDVSSVRNINLYADAGKETIRDTTLMYTWVYSDKGENYTSSTVGDKEPENKHSNNFVQADGKLVAGVQNKQYITIGKEGELVFRNPDTLEAVNNYGNQVAVGKPTIEASSGVDTGAIVVGTFDYGTTLFERYNELGELMQGYADDPSSTAYIGYKTERERIFDQLNQMGLVQTLTDEKGNKYQAAIEGMTVDYIELPDIVASGGNINIQTDTLSGSGSLKAQGAPEVVINNNTNLYMKINNITVGEPGGEINFNNNSLTSSNYQEKITELNADKTMGVNFNEVSPDAESGTGGRLVINGNYGGGTVYAKVNVDGKEQLIQTTPRADIEINGIVNSQGGTVEITSAANNIIIQGETAEDSAAVKGQTVKLSASKGSVSQGFQEGIVSIGGNVQDQYKDLYQGAKDEFNDKYGFKHDSVKDTWVTSSEGNKPNGNMIAGENIYISASDINVNGKIQSGYADYVVNIDSSVQSQIEQIKNNWQNSGGQTLTDAMVTTGTAYRIVEGKDVLQSDGSYYRQLDVYYNPSTG